MTSLSLQGGILTSSDPPRFAAESVCLDSIDSAGVRVSGRLYRLPRTTGVADTFAVPGAIDLAATVGYSRGGAGRSSIAIIRLDAHGSLVRSFAQGGTATAPYVPSCAGRVGTIVGTPAPDQLHGTNPNDVLIGLGSKDEIEARDGDDRVCGGLGSDRINLGPGNDIGFGGPGPDTIFGGLGDDLILGQGGKDRLRGGPGKDRVFPGRQ